MYSTAEHYSMHVGKDMLTQEMMGLVGMGEFVPNSWLLQFLSGIICNQITSIFGCENLLWLVAGFDDLNMNRV